MKKSKNKHLLTLIRNAQGMHLIDIQHKSGHRIHSISEYENNKRTPYKKTINEIAKAVNVNPDILFYSFGILPNHEMEIIKSDPFYYMERIKQLCNNHDNRYKGKKVDLNKLNCLRSFEYINKGTFKDEDEEIS